VVSIKEEPLRKNQKSKLFEGMKEGLEFDESICISWTRVSICGDGAGSLQHI
jgi:hypothetical protein